jgi:hypothetical protein
MKQLTTVALILSLGVAAAYAEQRPLKMTFSGSMVATALNLQPNSITDEEQVAGNGTLGSFTLRKLRIDGLAPRPSSNCMGANHANIPVTGGGGVFRFQDGSLLTVAVTGGDLCIDFTAAVGHLTETYQITGGTGRFSGAAASCRVMTGACTFKSTSTVQPVVADTSGTPKMLTITGEFAGTVAGLAIGEDRGDDRQ